MIIPSFERFLADMGPDFSSKLMQEAIDEMGPEVVDMARGVTISHLVSLNLLARYHDWLSRQLDTSTAP